MASTAEKSRFFSLSLARWEIPLLLLAMLIGGLLRFWALGGVPGLWYDEAINGLDALEILREPGFPIFFETENHMREPLLMYLEAAGLALMGVSAWSLRAVSVLIGIATIPVVWGLARELRGPKIALLATLIFVLMRWHVHFSTLAFRTILAPLFAAAAAWMFFVALRRRKTSDAVLCGAILGAGAYTYLSFRLFPVILLLAVIPVLLKETREGRIRLLRLGGIAAGCAFLVFLPLGIDYVRNPDHFTGRGEEVQLSRHGNPTVLVLRQARDVALMPIARGDHVEKHNFPGPPKFLQIGTLWMDGTEVAARWQDEMRLARAENRPPRDPHGTGAPLFDPLTAVLFYIGLGAALWNSPRDPVSAGLAGWVIIGSLASMLSFGAPNMLRLLMLTPAVAIIIGEGLRLAARLINRRFSLPFPARILLSGIFLIWFGAVQLRVQAAWPRHPMVPRGFNVESAELARFLAHQPDRLPVRLPEPLLNPTIRFIADGYEFNPGPGDLGDRWWELRSAGPIPAIEPLGEPVSRGRTHRMTVSGDLLLGVLVEVKPAD